MTFDLLNPVLVNIQDGHTGLQLTLFCKDIQKFALIGRPPHTLLSGHEYSYVVYGLMGVYNEISGSTEWLSVGGVEQRDHILKCLIAPCVSSNAAWYLIGILKSLSSIYLYTFIPFPPSPEGVCVWSLDPHAGLELSPLSNLLLPPCSKM